MGNTFRDFCSQALQQSQATAKPQMNSDSLTGLNCSGTVSSLWRNIRQTANHTAKVHSFKVHGYLPRARFTLILSLYSTQAALSHTSFMQLTKANVLLPAQRSSWYRYWIGSWLLEMSVAAPTTILPSLNWRHMQRLLVKSKNSFSKHTAVIPLCKLSLLQVQVGPEEIGLYRKFQALCFTTSLRFELLRSSTQQSGCSL